MHQKPNCKQITSAIKAIRNKKALFETKIEEGDVNFCLETKTDLLEMIKKLEFELWPFEQEELSTEKLKETYEQYKSLFESNGIAKDGKISEELLPDELKGETFLMPTEEQFLERILSKQKNVKEMVKLGLVEPILVPIAADFGDFAEVDGYWTYSGLLSILARNIRTLGKLGELKGSDGMLLPTEAELENCSASLECPVYLDKVYKKILHSFKNEDGTFSEGLTQKQFIQKHKDTTSPFPGFSIYFKEKGNLPRKRDEKDPLNEIVNRDFQQFKESLHKLGLTGSTVNAELIILLASMEKDGKVTRDWNNEHDAAGFIGGNTFQGSAVLGSCNWFRDGGRFFFDSYNPSSFNSLVAGIPLGELV